MKGLAWAGAAIAALASGCPQKVPIQRPYPPPTPEELLQVLAARRAVVKSMNASVRATSWLGGERVRATVLVLADRPGRLRFEAEVSLQGTVAILATDGTRFQLLDLQKNVLQQGPACPENVASMIRIPLEPRDVAAVLLGDVPVPADARGTVDWDATEGADVLTLQEAGRLTRIRLRRENNAWRIVSAERIADSRTVWRIRHEDPEAVAGQPLPGKILFAEGTKSFDDGVEIKFKDRTVNPPLPDASFRVEAPPGARVVEVGCGE